MSKRVIRISEENFKVIQNLKPGEFITIKHKNRQGKIVLKAIDDGNVIFDNPSCCINNDDISKLKVKYILKLELPRKYYLNFDEPFGYDQYSTEEENIKMKFLLKDKGNHLFNEKYFKEAIDYYEYLKKNSYFEYDWYPYRQLTIIYEKLGKYEENIENIKQLFCSDIYCNGYQYFWFLRKLNKSSIHVSVTESEIKSWLDYYWEHGAKNKEKLDTPVFIADRIVKRDNKIRVYSKDIFYNNYQKLSEFQQKVLFYEELDDYEMELDSIKSYFQEFYSKISDKECEWFKNKLEYVNVKLGTNYYFHDFV